MSEKIAKRTARLPVNDSPAKLFAGPGEMRALCRALDWSATPLGPVDSWPGSLRTIVSTMLASRHPMFLFWGPELVQIYNDAYRVSLADGGRHPRALGMRGIDFWTEIWEIIGPQIEQVMTGGEATWHEDHLVPIERNGRLEMVYWTYSYSPVPDDDGGVGGTLVVCQETTARVLGAAELARLLAENETVRARLGQVLAQAPAAVAVLLGRLHVIHSVNEMFMRLFGRREYVRRRARDATPELVEQGCLAHMDQAYRTGVPFHAQEARFAWDRDGDGVLHEGFFDFVYQPIVTADGTVEGTLIFAIDVTAQVRSRREVEAGREAAEAASLAKSRFLSVMSHELRTPLNAIGGYAELMEMGIHGSVSAEQHEDLVRIQRSQRHVLGLINEVLDYARLESGSFHFRIVDTSVRNVLIEAESLVSPQAQVRKMRIVTSECSPDLAVRADPERLRQILVNLISNAVKFTDRGGEVTIGCEADEEHVHVTVLDSGIGIPESQRDHIFEPFVQVRDDLTRTAEGTGLGLAISRDLARGMGGDVDVAWSEPGRGSMLRLRLPRAR